MDSIETLQEKVARLASILNTYQQTVEEERILLSRFFLNAADVLSGLAAIVAPEHNPKNVNPSPILKRTIRELVGIEMTPRLGNLLMAMEIVTVEDITKHYRYDFIKSRGLGRKTMRQLETFMDNHGLTFKSLDEE